MMMLLMVWMMERPGCMRRLGDELPVDGWNHQNVTRMTLSGGRLLEYWRRPRC